MKITKSRLKQIVKEELQNLNEGADEEDLQAFDALMGLPAASQLPTGKIAADDPQSVDNVPEEVALMEDLWDVVRGFYAAGRSDVALKLQKIAEMADAGHERLMPRGEGTPGMSDEPPFRGPDPRKTAELRQQTRAQGGYSGKGAWKPRE